ncbi:hypothetical protein BN946_scf184707.g2 [Trametes cinnabarina]|uniref:Fungal-type protein kinase domain-containing protein n=1 Tax=Pycnoporus cinnabarinus TaxID=5643 RepID=A0A060S2P0_PYCCI|nr:hypothetical protein BN946_scf184707.g2 [Trametes cinnabarina]
MSSDEQLRTPSPAPPQETAGVNADETSATHVSSGTPFGLVPSPIRRPGFTAHNRKAVEELAYVDPDPAFFEHHLQACPASLVKAIEKRRDVQKWINDINKVKTKEASLYQPVASLLSTISEKVFDHLLASGAKERLHLPRKSIMFLDHHRHAPTHFPVGKVDDKPDIIGAIGRDGGYRVAQDGSYEGVPYHCIETIVEAKAIYGDGQAQATRYAFNIQQARPDRPGFYCLSVKPGKFQVVYSSPVGIEASEHKDWNDCDSLCAYIYSLYDPPAGHILCDRTLVPREPAGVPLGKPSWTIQTQGGTYSGASIIFLGDPWGRRTTVFRVTRNKRSVIIKESYIDCGRRFQEAELLMQIHQNGFVPGVVRHITAEDVKNGDDIIMLSKKDGELTRKKRRMVLADVGQDLSFAESVNDLLMVIYDTLEVHRMLARDRQILHRDMTLFNILMYPSLAPCVEGRFLRNSPPLIDDVLRGELRSPEQRSARCLIIDLDNAASLVAAKANAIPEELRCRTGTPAYIARAVSSGSVYTAMGTLRWSRKMPELSGEAKQLYIKLYGEGRYLKYLDTGDTVHGGLPPREAEEDIASRARKMTFYHRWEYDAESVFWTMYAALLRAVPKASPKESKGSSERLNENWKALSEHTIPRTRRTKDSRDALLDQDPSEFEDCFLPAMQDVAQLVYSISRHVYPAYAAMTPPPVHEDHLHEAMQRLILQYLVHHLNDPIPLVPGKLRPVKLGDNPVVNRGTYGTSFQEQDARGEKRSRDPVEATPMLRRLTRASASTHEDPPVFGDGGFELGWEMRMLDEE